MVVGSIPIKVAVDFCLPERPWNVQGRSFCKERLHGRNMELQILSLTHRNLSLVWRLVFKTFV